jgi:hypothetical protein
MAKPESRSIEQTRASVVAWLKKHFPALINAGQILYWLVPPMVLGIYGLFVHNQDLAQTKGKFGICLFIVLGAALLTAFKIHFRWIFGIGQIGAGLLSCWLSMNGFAKAGVTRYQAILFLGGSIYLLREGMETFWDGVTGESESEDEPAVKRVTPPGPS